MTLKFELDVQQVRSICCFRLTWGNGQKLVAELPYPETVFAAYQHWEKAYIAFYQSDIDLLPPPPFQHPSSDLRARVEQSGVLEPSVVDWRLRLAQAQATLLSEFHGWLSGRELLPLRAAIAQAQSKTQNVEIFLTCNPIALDRLPWETWEIATEFAARRAIRFARTPLNLPESPKHPRKRQSRILMILGDETGLDFAAEKRALKALRSRVEVHFIGWQGHQSQPSQNLKETIRSHLEDPKGWDILCFAGHSNETLETGGEIAIAPNQGILMSELLPSLRIAQANGLQFALFNSCRGLSIAHSLASIGIPEVAIMRHPVHNRVASEFLVQFIQQLVNHGEVHSALITTCEYLKIDKNQTYPSAFLIPSLFRHPAFPSFKLNQSRWRNYTKQWLPNRREAIMLVACAVLSILSPVQGILLEQRVLLQSFYRSLTHQVPQTQLPPVRLIQIDPATIQNARIRVTDQIDRQFLAQIVERLTDAKAKVIGFDYFFDRPGTLEEDKQLARAIQQSVSKNQTWFVFAEAITNEGRIRTAKITGIGSPQWSLSGLVNTDRALNTWYLKPSDNLECEPDCPFPNLLAIAHLLAQSSSLQPKLNSSSSAWQSQTLELAKSAPTASRVYQIRTHQELPLTNFSRYLGQLWLQPILDFSIPPNAVFETTSAGELVKKNAQLKLNNLPNQVVLIASGGYTTTTTLNSQGSDTYEHPKAISYWNSIGFGFATVPRFTGAESIAYAIHHQLNRRLLVPVPDLWMIVIAAILGGSLRSSPRFRQYRWLWLGGLGVYGIGSLQLYIIVGIVVPFLLPMLVLIWYGFPYLQRRLPNV
jgi:hypothetical protein